MVEVAFSGVEGSQKAIDFKEVVVCGIAGNGRARGSRGHTRRGDAVTPEDIARAQEAGFDYHLARPPTTEKLRQIAGIEDCSAMTVFSPPHWDGSVRVCARSGVVQPRRPVSSGARSHPGLGAAPWECRSAGKNAISGKRMATPPSAFKAEGGLVSRSGGGAGEPASARGI